MRHFPQRFNLLPSGMFPALTVHMRTFRVATYVCLAGFWLGDPALGQPTNVEVVAPNTPARPGQPYAVKLEVSWAGSPDAYRIAPPEIPEIGWGEARLSSAYGEPTGDGHKIVQVIEFIADTEGAHSVPAIAIPYIDPADEPQTPSETAAEREEAPELPTVTAAGFTISVQKSRTRELIFAASGIALLVVAAGFVALYRARRRALPSVRAPISGLALAREAVHAAKKHRLDGNFYAFFVTLRNGAVALRDSAEGARLHSALDEWANKTGYGGVQPTHDELDGLTKDYEKALQTRLAVEATAASEVAQLKETGRRAKVNK